MLKKYYQADFTSGTMQIMLEYFDERLEVIIFDEDEDLVGYTRLIIVPEEEFKCSKGNMGCEKGVMLEDEAVLSTSG